MVLQAVAFYLLAATTLIAGLLVVLARNPVHSVLFLIAAFFSAAGLFVLLGAEFLAMILIVVYVGAVAVLFLFVVMMLDVDFSAGHSGPVTGPLFGISNTEAIGRVLYTRYVYLFQAAGMVLLVAMIGAIVLTLKHRPGIRRQNIADQVARTPASGMRIVQVASGQGIERP